MLLPVSGSPALDIGQETDVSHITSSQAQGGAFLQVPYRSPTCPQGTQPGTQLWQCPKLLPQKLRLLMYPSSQCHPKCCFTRVPCEPVWLEGSQGEGVCPSARAAGPGNLPACTAPSPEELLVPDGLRLRGLREAGAPWRSECCHPCSRSWPRPG